MTQERLIKMSIEQATALTRILADADMRGVLALDKTRPLGELLNAWDKAPPRLPEPIDGYTGEDGSGGPTLAEFNRRLE